MSSPVPVPYGAGGGLVSAKGGYHYLALSPRNKMVMRSGEQELQYETKNKQTMDSIEKTVNHLIV